VQTQIQCLNNSFRRNASAHKVSPMHITNGTTHWICFVLADTHCSISMFVRVKYMPVMPRSVKLRRLFHFRNSVLFVLKIRTCRSLVHVLQKFANNMLHVYKVGNMSRTRSSVYNKNQCEWHIVHCIIFRKVFPLFSPYYIYMWTSLCRSGRDPEKYFDIGMVRDNQLGITGSESFWQNISLKNAYLQASFYHLPLLISFI